jgi:hypothetical protein
VRSSFERAERRRLKRRGDQRVTVIRKQRRIESNSTQSGGGERKERALRLAIQNILSEKPAANY